MIRWLSPEILQWEAYPASAQPEGRGAVQRAYAHWRHAEQMLRRAQSEFERTDVVTTLKRAVDHRLRLLNEYYRWSNMRCAALPKGMLQQLEHLGVARHTMVRRLTDLRNRIEHADETPPSLVECADHVEMVWYFLRATDLLVTRVPTSIELAESDPGGDARFLMIDTGPEHEWRALFHGVVPGSHVSASMHDDWIRVDATRCESRMEWLAAASQLPEEVRDQHSRKQPTDYLLQGEILGPSDALLQIYRGYLSPF
jgi:hypothetical protein